MLIWPEYPLQVAPLQSLLPFVPATQFNQVVRCRHMIKLMLDGWLFAAVQISLDSTKKKLSLSTKWQEGSKYRLIINNAAVTDSAGNNLPKSDTIRFSTKKETDYGNVVLRFSNLDLSKHPVIQFVVGDEVKFAYPLTATEWSKKIFKPGEYELRILYDDNNNGKWDPGHYSKKVQPEKAITLPQKLNVKGNWDNEMDLRL